MRVDTIKTVLAKLAGPMLVSVLILGVFFLGGDAYRSFGLEALDTTSHIFKYVLGVVGFISLASLINRLIRYVIFDGFVASATGVPVPKLLSQLSGLIIYLVAISACARIVFNQDLTFLWAASGVAGLVLGMALRELLQDVFAGIALNIDRATRIGDYIQIHRAGDDRTVGQLIEISWRTTRVKDLMGDMLSFPNSKFSAFTISNFSLPEAVSMRRVTVTLENTVDPDRAIRILQAAAVDALNTIVGPQAPAPTVAVNLFKPEGVEYVILYTAGWSQLVAASRAIHYSVLVHLSRVGLRPASQTVALARQHPATGLDEEQGQAREALWRTPALRGLTSDEMAILVQGIRRITLAADQVLVQFGEVGGELYVLLEGLASADGGPGAARKAGGELLRPGAVFDVRAAFMGEPHRRTVRTRTPAVFFEVSGAALAELLAQSPHQVDAVARQLIEWHGVQMPVDDGEDPHEALVRHIRQLFPSAAASPRGLRLSA